VLGFCTRRFLYEEGTAQCFLDLAGPTSDPDPDLDLSYEFITRESARLPRVRPPHRAGLSKERVLQ
jgi:hypothetical protein